ncbi:23S rRNA pseudouridine2457 synthase [Chitinophaga sp. CF118]|nr:23S rRNA pseudouridine2457 synthase [Chitinophaga sp. CF118]
MVSQFISPDKVRLLGDMDFDFPEGTHAIGRLDSHSEGLLILTTNKKVTNLLFKGEVPHKRTYLVMVKHVVSPESVELLRNGINIIVKGGEGYITTPCEAAIVEKPSGLFHRPQALREQLPHTWLEITLTEGKFHQIRKMVMAIGHRCLRLIRTSIEDLELGDLPPGGVREIEERRFFELLKIRTSENITA